MRRSRLSDRVKNSGRTYSPDAYRIRITITIPAGRRLQVLIYARFSTDEQNPRSIDDQFAHCRRLLDALGITDVEIEYISDEGISGELVSRPGIDRVRVGLGERRWDLIIAEDSSRVFRNETACMQLVETAVDAGIRVLLPGDDVDTAEETWKDRLYEAQRHHARSNAYTSRRIKRAHEALFEQGAAIGLLKPGYRRTPTTPATDREPERGPYFDEVEESQAKLVYEAFERIARHEVPESVATWLTAVALPKTANATRSEWTDENVKHLIRRKDYRGVQEFRNTCSKSRFGSGRREQERNNPERILNREMEHLRIVPDWLWYEANEAIDARDHGGHASCGADNPLKGVPRRARGPLSGIFHCVCGASMEIIGCNGYRCARAKGRNARCWNRATAKRDVAHLSISNAILQSMETMVLEIDPLLRQVTKLCDGGLDQASREAELLAEEQQHLRELKCLQEVAKAGSSAPDILLQWITQQETGLARVRADRERLAIERQKLAVPTKQGVLGRIDELRRSIQHMDRQSRGDLIPLMQNLAAVPCQQVGSNKVVLRARFQLSLLPLLPPGVSLFLGQLDPVLLPPLLTPRQCLVDLFSPSAGPRYWKAALELADQGNGLTAIGNALQTTKRNAHIALMYGRQLRELGLSDAFMELHGAPGAASRWRISPRNHNA